MITQNQSYSTYPFGFQLPGRNESAGDYRYGFNGMEKDDEILGSSNNYTTKFRQYDCRVARWLSVDFWSDKYPWQSTYCAMDNNPNILVDPSGLGVESTIVTDNGDGTYKVVGGSTTDGDKGIYVVELNDAGEYERTGEVIGVSLTMNSFYNEDKGSEGWYGTINLNAKDEKADDGLRFLRDEIIDSKIGVLEYISKAKGKEELDFKHRGFEDGMNKLEHYYRGYSIGSKVIPISGIPGITAVELPLIASARDIGNFAAGYVAGYAGVSWASAQIAFDILESYQKGSPSTEQKGTRDAQRLGWNDGKTKRHQEMLKEDKTRGVDIRYGPKEKPFWWDWFFD